MELWAAAKKLKLVWQCHELLSGFLANGPVPRVSRMSANDKGDNDMIPRTVHRSPGIYLVPDETQENIYLNAASIKT